MSPFHKHFFSTTNTRNSHEQSLSQFLPQNVTMGRVNSSIIILHQFSLFKSKPLRVKFYSIQIGCLNMQHYFIYCTQLSILLGFKVFKDGRDQFGTDAVIAIGSKDSEGHYVETASSRTEKRRRSRSISEA